ncbi:MAG TPA: hypothetical protein VGQ50_03870 [Actinomycetota bacterium]|jgi:hypothetical protein|nr:hypothetical protein [Actinomycetota bacterium]
MNRYLVVSDLMVGSNQLKDFLRNQLGDERPTFYLVVPTIPDRRRLAWDESEAHLIARRRLVNGLEWMREVDPGANGEVGDVDPILAIEDALRTTDYDAIVLAVRERPHRRRLRVAARARQAFDLPVVDVLTAA